MTRIDIEAARALLARVEAADGPDRDIDLQIDAIICGLSRIAAYATPYTSSQDAATALIARVLPEAAWGVSVEPPTPAGGVKYHAFVGDHFPSLDAMPGKWWGEADYRDGAAQALCIALLRAVIAKAEAGERP